MRPTPAPLAPALALFVGLLLAVACGPGAPAASNPHPSPPQDEAVYLSDGSLITVVEGAGGRVLRRMPAGMADPTWSRLYSVAGGDANPQLRVVDTATGAIARAVTAPAWADQARLSANGRWLALTDKPDPEAPLTRFRVRDAELATAPVDVELQGAFFFDGLSDDGRRLFLLQLRPDGSYLVRLYDLAAGRLAPGAIADKTDGSTVISGALESSLTTRDGQEQLTLYEGDPRHQAFVHVLPIGTATEFAYCVDLPAPGTGWSLAAVPGGRRFIATNMTSDSVVTIAAGGLGPPEVRSARLDSATAPFGLVHDAEAKEGSHGAAGPPSVISADGRTLFSAGGDGVVRVDAATLRKGSVTRLSGEGVLSLALGPSGWLYATTERGQLLRIDPGSMGVAWKSARSFSGSAILHIAGSTASG
jgi:hypothetical protein